MAEKPPEFYINLMGPVAERIAPEFHGEMNQRLSRANVEWRFGKHGSLAVNLQDGVWKDHESDVGGGVLDMIEHYLGKKGRDAWEWLENQGLVVPERVQGGAGGQDNGKYLGFMDHHPIATYDYHDSKGKLAYQVLKFPKEAKMRFMQRRPYKGGWVWSLRAGEFGFNGSSLENGNWFKTKQDGKYKEVVRLDDVEWYLYRQKEVLQAIKDKQLIFIVEGEKDADTVFDFGFVATTNQGGSKNWLPRFSQMLEGAHVILALDNDKAGAARALTLGGQLKGVAASVRVLDLKADWPELPEKGDISDWRDQHGGDREKLLELIDIAKPWVPEKPDSRFDAFTWDELDRPGKTYDYIIEEIFSEEGVSVLAGASKSGKSFLAIEAAMSIALGRDFFGHEVKAGGVLYQAGEGARGIINRFKAYRTHYNITAEDVPLVCFKSKVNLFDKDGNVDAFIEELKAWKTWINQPLRILFIDTLAKAQGSADENSGKDMGLILNNAERIRDELGIHVCLVHHMNAAGNKIRGHSSVLANLDEVIIVSRDETTNIRTATMDKVKDGEDGWGWQFELLSVDIGDHPRTGKRITSCVTLPVGRKKALKAQQDKEGFTCKPKERDIMMRFFKAQDLYGTLVTSAADGPEEAVGKRIVHFNHYLDYAVTQMMEVSDKTAARDQLRKEWKRHSQFLVKAGVLALKNPYFWWTGKPIKGFPHTFPPRDNQGSFADNLEGGRNPDEPPAYVQEGPNHEMDIPI